VELKHLKGLVVGAQDLSKYHELQTAPLITREAYIAAGYKEHSMQYGVMGQALSIQYGGFSSRVPHIHVLDQVQSRAPTFL
jgi:hypothetical protein